MPTDPTAVFDLDGCLADTAPDLVGALDRLLAEHGLPSVDFAAARSVAGRGGRALVLHGWAAAGRATLAEAEIAARHARFLELYGDGLCERSRLFDGAEAMLDTLAADGFTLAVCTNKPEGLARTLLDRLGVLDRFAALLGGDSLPVRKPDPRHLLETLARAGGRPDAAVMIGDTITDRDAARAAGVPIVLCRFGYAPEPVDALAPDAAIDALAELPALLPRLLTRARAD